jgi:beta-lactamase regulating signal transducer with metallopeptidase domain
MSGIMRATLSYTMMRLLLFFAALILLRFAGARNFMLVGLAVLISGIVSFILLSRQRDAMSGALAARVRGFRERLDKGTRAEDDD